ncbi:MAG: hypothetical protein ACLVBX_00655 [Faecalibacterium prausnitzii]
MLNATVMGQISVAKNLETIVSGMIAKISTVFRPRCLRLYAEDKMEELTGLLKDFHAMYRRVLQPGRDGLFCVRP